MSSYSRSTKHPISKEWDDGALWLDDYYGRHLYGVKFSDGEVLDPRDFEEIETRQTPPMVSVSLEDEGTGLQDLEIHEGGIIRKDVVVQVNSIDVEVHDEGTKKAKEVIEKEVFPRLSSADVVVTVTYRHPMEDGYLSASKTVKIPHVRKYAEACIKSFIETFVPEAAPSDFIVVEYYKVTDEVKVTTIDNVQ